ncbi:AAA family ATPase [Caballeronia sp. DA-9]|uniref:AAA family ATPase n=1 Tax=Caballeronia sp. DA-9 TaxID=3436237 RepID=UPI003F67FDCC
MLEKLGLKNFKAFENESLDIRPITIFLGPNNSGKSSVLSAAKILSQTVTSYDVNVPLLLNGALGDFGTYKDVVFTNNRTRHIEISFTIRPKDEFFARAPKQWVVDDLLHIKLKYKFRPTIREIIINEFEVYKGPHHALSCKYQSVSERYLVEKIGGINVPPSIKSDLSADLRLFHFLPRSVYLPKHRIDPESALANFLTEDHTEILRSVGRLCDPAFRFFNSLEYIGAMRQPPSRTYLFSGERNIKVGASGQHAASIIAMDSLRKGKKGKNIKSKIVDWLKKSGMASDIKLENLSDRHYELHIQNNHSKEFQNFADVGYGISQVIPVLVAGYNLTRGQTLMVEEPEIHLHPSAQAELGDFFLDLYNDGVKSIVESHSEYLVVRLQQHVAAGLISKNDVAFYYVHAGQGGKRVTRLTLDRKGVFEQPWPQGFFPQRLEEAKKLAQLRASVKEE